LESVKLCLQNVAASIGVIDHIVYRATCNFAFTAM